MIVHLARVDWTTKTNEIEQALDVPATPDAPGGLATVARVHQAEHAGGHKAIVDEDVLMDVQSPVPALEIAHAVIRDTVTQRQILGSCRRSNRISLHETEHLERLWQRGRSKEASRDRVSAQFLDGQSTSIIPNG